MTSVTNQSPSHQVVKDKNGGSHTLTPGETRDIDLSEGDVEYYGRLKGKDGRPPSLRVSGGRGAAGDTDEMKKVRESIQASVRQEAGKTAEPAQRTEPTQQQRTAEPVQQPRKKGE